MSAIQSLPLTTLAAFVAYNEDWLLGLAFSQGAGAASLSGIAFTFTVSGLGSVTTGGGEAQTSANTLIVFAPAAQKTSWLGGVYPLSLIATDGTYSRELMVGSTLAVGRAGPPTLSAVGSAPISAALLSPSAIAALLAPGGGTPGQLDFSNSQNSALNAAVI